MSNGHNGQNVKCHLKDGNVIFIDKSKDGTMIYIDNYYQVQPGIQLKQ